MILAMSAESPEDRLFGSWKITKMDVWPQDYVDLVVPGFIRFDGETGEFVFGVVRGDLVTVFTTNRGQPYAKFAWTGEAEWDPQQGTGWVRLTAKDTLKGHLSISHGDASDFEAKPTDEHLVGYRPGPKWGRRRRRR